MKLLKRVLNKRNAIIGILSLIIWLSIVFASQSIIDKDKDDIYRINNEISSIEILMLDNSNLRKEQELVIIEAQKVINTAKSIQSWYTKANDDYRLQIKEFNKEKTNLGLN